MTKLKFTLPVVNGNNYFVVNLPAALTIQERKLHRACLEYKINGGYIFDSNNEARLKLGAIPDSWPVRSAIKRARNHWLTMHKEIFSNNPQLKPKWHDFKPAMIREQLGEGDEGKIGGKPVHDIMIPQDLFDDNVPSNWAQGHTWSKYTTENHNHPIVTNDADFPQNPLDREEFTCHILGNHLQSSAVIPGASLVTTTSIGALESWINSRPDLSPVSTISATEKDEMMSDPLTMLFNDGGADDEILENFTNAVDGNGVQEGDSFPMYHLQRPVNTPMEVAAACVSTAAPVAYFTGFNALCGQVLLKLHVQNTGIDIDYVDIVFDVDPRGMSI